MNKKCTKVISECAELIQAIYKAERHGWNNWHPNAKSGVYNVDDVMHEIADVEKAISELKDFITKRCGNRE